MINAQVVELIAAWRADAETAMKAGHEQTAKEITAAADLFQSQVDEINTLRGNVKALQDECDELNVELHDMRVAAEPARKSGPLDDLFFYHAESLAAADADMIDGDDFEIEYDGGHSGDVSISGLMAEALKRLRQAEADQDRLKVELENRSHEPDMTASDAYHYCADLIEPHVVDMPHGTECNEQSLCRSVCGSLAYLITHWQEVRGLREERDQLAAREAAAKSLISRLIEAPAYRGGPRPAAVQEFIDWSSGGIDHLARRDARMKAEALEEAADMARDEVWQQEFASLGQLQRDMASKAAEYREQAEGGQ